jgi:hypothetical protein
MKEVTTQERIAGTGKLYAGDQLVGEVDYTIIAYQETEVVQTHDGEPCASRVFAISEA